MNKNQNGFDVFFISVALVLLIGLGFVGWFVYQKNQDTKTSKAPQTSQEAADTPDVSSDETAQSSYDAAVVARIANFDAAGSSLKDSLVNLYYPGAKERCDIENEGVAAEKQIQTVMTVEKVVRNEFASVRFCGAESPSVLAYRNETWQNVTSLSGTISCDIVDQFKITKELIPECTADGEARVVTYP